LPFFQLVDELSNNRKIKALLDPTLDGDTSGCTAFTVWALAGTTCQAAGEDGVVKRADVARILLNPQLSLEAAALLVRVGLWHAPGHDCSRCPPVEDGTFLFHDWFDLRYDTGAAVRLKRRKAAELKTAKIVAAVWARDCIDPKVPAKQMSAHCRYCGTVVARMANNATVKPHLDHVDPSVTNGARNIVIACSICNQNKGQRTPKAAGMELRPAPRTVAEQHTNVVVSPPRSDDGLVSSPRSDDGLSSPGSSREEVLAGRDADEAVLAGRDDAGTRSATQGRSTRPQVADAPSTAEPGSPGQPVDGTRHDSGTAPATTGRVSDVAEDPDQTPPETDRTPPEPEQTGIKPDQPENQLSDTVLAGVRAHVRQAGSGQGDGLGRGLGEGHSSGSPDHHPSGDTARKRGRRRSRGRSRSSTKQASPNPSPDRPVNPFPPRPATTAQILDPSMDAGAAPDVDVPARFGSPWFGWTGPASTVTETICETHGQHEPCSTCKTSEE
jgi:5-methylcytosine-specific restriction endonuclease McrA